MFTGVDSYTFEMVDSNAAPEVVGYKNIVQQIKEKNPHMYCDTFWPGFSPYNGYENLNDYGLDKVTDYNSHNTERLDVEGMKKLLLKLLFLIIFLKMYIKTEDMQKFMNTKKQFLQ